MDGALILYVILPYVCLAVFAVGLVWRFKTDQYGWGARSTQLLEGRLLRYGSVIFHLGVLAAIGGHVMGILLPKAWTDAVGLSPEGYHVIAVIGGVGAGSAVIVGFVILLWRRATKARVRVTTKTSDLVVFALLAIGIVTGMLATLTNLGDAVHYRATVAPYFREIFILSPDPDRMTGGEVNLIFQIHVISAWVLYAAWPFSRLVHAFSVPFQYLVRSPIVYRRREQQPTRSTLL